MDPDPQIEMSRMQIRGWNPLNLHFTETGLTLHVPLIQIRIPPNVGVGRCLICQCGQLELKGLFTNKIKISQ